MTFDNCDGKQARKTGNSTPLGMLFDHGCDSLIVTLQVHYTTKNNNNIIFQGVIHLSMLAIRQ